MSRMSEMSRAMQDYCNENYGPEDIPPPEADCPCGGWDCSALPGSPLPDCPYSKDILMSKPRPKTPGPIHVLKQGNLFGEVPLDVPYAGCAHSDCIEGCDLGKGHCQRLEDAFVAAGYRAFQ